jgi:peptide/nickel transport system substrate-binding protein
VTALDTNMASTSSLASNFKAVKDIKAVNPTTVQIDLSAPIAATFPLTLAGASGLIAVKDPSAPGGYSGAGPFKIVSYSPGVSLKLARWSGYWDAGSIKLGGIDFLNVTANAPAAAALRSGSIDVAEFAPESIPSLTGESYVVQNRQMYYMMTFNLGTAPFNNVKFRQALNYAVNRKAVDQVIDLGKGQPTDEPYAKTFAAFSSAAAKLYPYNVKRAKKLLAEAGFPHGVTIHVITPPAVEVGLTEIADVLQQDFAAIGVTMDIQPVPLAAFLSSYYESKSSQAAVVLWTPPTNPAATLLEQFTPTGYENAAHYSNPGDYTNQKLNALLAEAQSAPTAAARSKALQSASLLVTQQALSLPITFSPLVTAYDSQVGGTVVHLGYCSGITWSKVYMRK